ncbi:S-adenosylmethionine/S-adenosylhomocysteine transporter [Pontiella desulfatans]|uniref:S-adenosylmethionine/S-adenosylhomocysteine transporter n=1 Tax=Pontiella desulfatans TaxID=2750659 RepID=A0A6C2TX69_PONDE|nr:DMT family transporter [Pontiella desulfatans]VGO12209.1 S-adenosylmethionine/S-adenosylhomocysteine transporter [Pontiella desulfatans]
MSKPGLLRLNLLAIFACLLWSTSFVTSKHALDFQEPLNLAGLRFVLAGLIQIPLCGSLAAPIRMLRKEFTTVLLVSLFHTIFLYGTFFIGLNWVRGAEGAIMIGVGPLASALMAHLLMHDDKMQRRTLVSIVFGMVGVALISLATKPWSPVGLKEFFGLMLLLSGAVVSAIGNIVVAKRKGGLHPIALNSAQMLLGGIVLLLIALPFEGPPQMNQPASFFGALAWLSIISATAFAIWFHLLSKIKVSKLNLWKFLIPLSGAALSWLLLPDESPTLPSLIGMAFIIAGIVIGQVEGKRVKAKSTQTA